MTKREKILTIILAGILVGYGYYQVAYGTNESDYRKGFNTAKTDWSCLVTSGDCGYPYYTPGDVCYKNNTTHNVDNITACTDGYVAGFVSWCSSDQKDCVHLVRHTGFPNIVNFYEMKGISGPVPIANSTTPNPPVIAAITGPGHCDKTGCESGNFTSIR